LRDDTACHAFIGLLEDDDDNNTLIDLLEMSVDLSTPADCVFLVPPVRGYAFFGDFSRRRELAEWWEKQVPADAVPVYMVRHFPALSLHTASMSGIFMVLLPDRSFETLYPADQENVATAIGGIVALADCIRYAFASVPATPPSARLFRHEVEEGSEEETAETASPMPRAAPNPALSLFDQGRTRTVELPPGLEGTGLDRAALDALVKPGAGDGLTPSEGTHAEEGPVPPDIMQTLARKPGVGEPQSDRRTPSIPLGAPQRSDAARRSLWGIVSQLRGRVGGDHLGLHQHVDLVANPVNRPFVIAVAGKGGAGKSTISRGLSEVIARIGDYANRRVVLVDANVVNSDQWLHLGIPEHAATLRAYVDAVMDGQEPPLPAFCDDYARGLAYLPERGTPLMYSRTMVRTTAQRLRESFDVVVLDLSNVLPAENNGGAAEVNEHWMREADLFVIPVDRSRGAFEHVPHIVEIARDRPTVAIYREPSARLLRRDPELQAAVDAVAEQVTRWCCIPEDPRVERAALHQEYLTEASPAVARAIRDLAVTALELNAEVRAAHGGRP
jgi:CO dehydrogenase nickel-insertion accessory protein CooC1